MGHRHMRARMYQQRASKVTRSLEDMQGLQCMSDRQALEAIFATMSDGVVVYDRDGHVVCMNAVMNRLLGVNDGASSAELSSNTSTSGALLHFATDGSLLTDVISQMGKRSESLPVTTLENTAAMPFRIHMPGGQERWLSVTMRPLLDASEEVFGTIAVFRDETEHQHMMRERSEALADVASLRETVQRMEEFLAVAAHDLRSPLTVALGNLQLTQRRFARQRARVNLLYPEFTSPFEVIGKGLREATRGVQQLVRSAAVLLDVARASAGRFELKLQRFDLVDLVCKQVQSQRLVVAHRVIHLGLHSDQPVMVNADEMRVGEVIANYMSNALKYSATELPVEVEVSMRDNAARVEVRDSGLGLPLMEQERVWEMYYRVPGVEPISDNSEGVGLGLGLHICKRIIEQHGGAVGVDSIMGAGSTFWFTLPLSPETECEVPSAVIARRDER